MQHWLARLSVHRIILYRDMLINSFSLEFDESKSPAWAAKAKACAGATAGKASVQALFL